MAREINQIIIQTIVFLSKSFGRPIQTTCCICSMHSKSAATLLPIGTRSMNKSCICLMHQSLLLRPSARISRTPLSVASVRCTQNLLLQGLTVLGRRYGKLHLFDALFHSGTGIGLGIQIVPNIFLNSANANFRRRPFLPHEQISIM